MCARSVVTFALLLLAVSGCSDDKDSGSVAAASCTPTGATGAGQAQVDGVTVQWADVVWSEAGDGVQVTTEASGEHRLTLVASGALAALRAGDADIEVALDSGGLEGFALLYAGSDSHSSKDGGGSLVLSGLDGDVVSGCFSFDTDGPAVVDGTFQARAL